MRRNSNLVLRTISFGAITAALALTGCKSEQKSDSGSVSGGTKTVAFNTVCPVSHHAVEADAPTRQYQGKTVGFCCEHCPETWDKKSVADRDAMMEKIAAK